MTDIPNTQISRPASNLMNALRDLSKGLKLWRLWTAMAWHSLQQRYRRTWIGIGWLGVSFSTFMLVKIFIFGAMSGTSTAYYAGHLALGYWLYRLFANGVNGGTSVFISAATWIKSEPLPLSVHLYKLLTTNFIIFAITAIPTIGICLYYNEWHIEGLVWLLPALAVFSFATVFVALILGILSARYRDIMHFSSTIMQVTYFISPVLWIPPETGPRATVALINPFTHFMAIVRQPLMDGTFPALSWMVVLGCCFALFLTALVLFTTSQRKLVFWL